MTDRSQGFFDRFADTFESVFRHKTEWTPADMKSPARISLLRNFPACLLASLILGALEKWTGYLLIPRAGQAMNTVLLNLIRERLAVLAVFSVATLILSGPLEVGCRRFYLQNARGERPEVKEIFRVFTDGFVWQRIRTMMPVYLLKAVGYLFFLVPGVLAGYVYRLVPYLLAEQPGMNTLDAMKLSREKMRGNKWDAFLLDLSFWPWILASAVTFGLAGVAFGWPYHDAAGAELFRTIMDENYR